ncbi:MAG TPA: hypothetical protein VMT34_03770 [Aggregatilineales bacterium]|nr:hypothetical protein [Aggregatilineales bacterium]
MATNDYHFVTHWRIDGTLREVVDILSDAPGLARWWPSVYLDVRQLAPGDSTSLGKVVDLHTKSWLPYTRRWQFVVTEVTPISFSLKASGDFDGVGTWYFGQNGDYVDVVYDWQIRADKLLRDWSFIMKPIFGMNHRWAMQQGETSLKLELARRHANTEAERSRIPAPPAPTTSSAIPLLVAAAGLALICLIVLRMIFAPHREA